MGRAKTRIVMLALIVLAAAAVALSGAAGGGAGGFARPSAAAWEVGSATASVWIGLKNSDDVGTSFDIKAVSKAFADCFIGEQDGVPGGSSGFNNAHLVTIPLEGSDCGGYPTGFTLYVRVACTSRHLSGTARLWYDDPNADSELEVDESEFYLRTGFVLSPTPGPAPADTIDVLVKKSGCPTQPTLNWKPFGTWTEPS
jgi:hypothetical protein